MTNPKLNRILRLLLICSVLVIEAVSAVASARAEETPATGMLATLYSLEGTAERRAAGGSTWSACVQGQEFKFGDELKMGPASRAGIQFSDGLFIRLGSRASLRFDQKPGPGLFLGGGKAHFFNRDGGASPNISTAVVSAAIRGTEFVVDATTDTTSISVIEGSVEASNAYGSIVAGAGEEAITTKGKGPRKALMMSAADAVQWTAEIPVIFDWSVYDDAAVSKESRGLISSVKNLVSKKEYRKALAMLPSSSTSDLALLRADLLFSTGQIDEAANIIGVQRSRVSGKALAHLEAVDSLLELSKNNSEFANANIARAQDLDPNSPSVALAASYVAQYNKDLENARDLLRVGVQKNPDDALLLARLAELELAFNEVDEAERLIQRSLQIDPEEPYAKTVLGFIRLLQKNTADAKTLFVSASKDSGAGLPLLGLGLSKIYEGDLEAGKTELARAVLMEPSRAVYRSYLGKAYFELEEETRAINEYDEAIRLDPNDPTAWLYRGFANLSRNNVVGALSDVEKSFELNNNRAVFRSSLLLDEDLAVRSAGLSRIYNEIGFSERGRIEAISALGRDMGNFSAHNLLGEAQQEIFFADASLSERRVADLLAPLSFNLFSSLGGRASLNEYDALFDKSERRTAVSLGYDERSDQFSANVTYSGKSDVLGYAMAASSDLSDGSKSNNWGRDYRLAGALRYQIAPRHRLLLDLNGNYQKIVNDEAFPQEIEFDRGGGGLGYSYTVDANSTILAEFTAGRDVARSKGYDDVRPALSTLIFEDGQDTVDTELLIDPKLDEYVTGLRGGSQWIYRHQDLSVVSGFQVLSERPDRYEHSDVIDDALQEFADAGIQISSKQQERIGGSDVYFYPTYHVTRDIDVTAGVVRTDLKRELVEVPPFISGTDTEGRFNPKVGITASLLENLTVRSAYFESLRKSSLEDQVSIEPTIIGGITQRFNDLSGTESRNFGFGADYKLASSTYFGAEYVRRYLAEPGALTSTEIIANEIDGTYTSTVNLDDQYTNHVEQDFARAYIYQVLSPSLVASFDYRYGTDEVTDPDAGSDFLLHRCAGQLRYFHSSGMFAFTRATWRKQTGINDAELPDGKEIAWVFDAGIGYRIPKRRGTISLEVFNLADQNFAFDESRGFEDSVSPDIGVRLVAAVNF